MQGGYGGAAAGRQLADREFMDLLWNLGHSFKPTHLVTLRYVASRSVDMGPVPDHAKQSLRH
ncbi:hypothetical protein GCM10010094_82030 [Streptomyces flaveus]|uniref:Uncharacterized protein n=1 Tax=Streptomyces flaveus TaxID=66370 RepID=A0A917RHN9_9ACTN|nr:hypothetical protein GCM10010094_82030 [Streptomyces flaveus]